MRNRHPSPRSRIRSRMRLLMTLSLAVRTVSVAWTFAAPSPPARDPCPSRWAHLTCERSRLHPLPHSRDGVTWGDRLR